MNKKHKLLTAVIFTATTCAATARAEDPPLSCKFDSQGFIVCDVTTDNADLTAIVVNRNNCSMPTIPDDMRQKFQDIMDRAPPEQKSLASVDATLSLDPRSAEPDDSFDHWRPSDGFDKLPADNQLPTAIYYLLVDKRGKYKFGDRILIPTRKCQVLEWTIEVDGRQWTWRRKQ